jgi:hypothetical protein
MTERVFESPKEASQHLSEYTEDEIRQIRNYRQNAIRKSNELFSFISEFS